MVNIGNLAKMERDNPNFTHDLVQVCNEIGQGGAARHYGVSQSAVSQYLRRKGAKVVKVWKLDDVVELTEAGRAALNADKLTERGAVAAALSREQVSETFDQKPHFFTPSGDDLGAVQS